MSFQDLAFLVLPAHPGPTTRVVEVDERWRPEPPPEQDLDVIAWGREALRSGTPLRVTARFAAARERAVRSVRKHDSHVRTARTHRLPPPRLAGGRVRNRVRSALLGGALIELSKPPPVSRVIDSVAEQARTGEPVATFAPGSGGSALMRVRGPGGEQVLLRAARTGSPADPHRAAQALAALAPLGLGPIPRLLGRGKTAGASWTTESLLPGRRPGGLQSGVAGQIANLCSVLPRSDEAATAHEQDLASIAAAFPRWSALLDHVSDELSGVARAVPSAARHGDLWAGNLLVVRGRLTGIVDWDAWHPAALPGLDLLHLVAVDEQLRSHGGLGTIWLGKPWMGERFLSLTAEYWGTARIVPNDTFLPALGLAWWACHVAATIRRLPDLSHEDRWVQANVDQVLEALSGQP